MNDIQQEIARIWDNMNDPQRVTPEEQMARAGTMKNVTLQQQVTEMLRKEFAALPAPDIDLEHYSKQTLLQVLDAMRIYHIQEREIQAFEDDYGDLMTAIASRFNRKVWP